MRRAGASAHLHGTSKHTSAAEVGISDASILLGVGQACGLRTRPLPFRRAVARRELDFDRVLLGALNPLAFLSAYGILAQGTGRA